MDVKLKRGQKKFNCPKCSTTLEIVKSRFRSTDKGSKFERKVADDMSKAIYGKTGSLRRTPTSGAMSKFWPFDIMPKGDFDKFPFGIECKHRESWDFAELIHARRSKTKRPDTYILDWWGQLQKDCAEWEKREGSFKRPYLILVKNREEPIVLTRDSYVGAITVHLDYNNFINILGYKRFLKVLEGIKWD